jgi:hypothetical protein
LLDLGHLDGCADVGVCEDEGRGFSVDVTSLAGCDGVSSGSRRACGKKRYASERWESCGLQEATKSLSQWQRRGNLCSQEGEEKKMRLWSVQMRGSGSSPIQASPGCSARRREIFGGISAKISARQCSERAHVMKVGCPSSAVVPALTY